MDNLLPPNASLLERNLATVNARLGELPAPMRDLMNPHACPAPLLPWLAWALSVDSWDDAWSEAQKRAVIAASYQVHRKKGTLGAVQAALDALAVSAEVVEWWQETPRGVPGTFRVDVDTEGVGMADSFAQSIERQVVTVKPVRAHFTVRLVAKARPSFFVGSAYQDIITTTIYPKAP